VLPPPQAQRIEDDAGDRDEAKDDEKRIGHDVNIMHEGGPSCGVAISDRMATMTETTIAWHREARDLR
jgi:hypothetical protein